MSTHLKFKITWFLKNSLFVLLDGLPQGIKGNCHSGEGTAQQPNGKLLAGLLLKPPT